MPPITPPPGFGFGDRSPVRNSIGVQPFVGPERHWKACGMQPIQQIDPNMVWPSSGQKVRFAFPDGLFMIVVEGIRSDGMPCIVHQPVRYSVFKHPINLGVLISGMWAQLNSYRDCACVPHEPCKLHAPEVKTDDTPKIELTDRPDDARGD